jgi:hypothetical protein
MVSGAEKCTALCQDIECCQPADKTCMSMDTMMVRIELAGNGAVLLLQACIDNAFGHNEANEAKSVIF